MFGAGVHSLVFFLNRSEDLMFLISRSKIVHIKEDSNWTIKLCLSTSTFLRWSVVLFLRLQDRRRKYIEEENIFLHNLQWWVALDFDISWHASVCKFRWLSSFIEVSEKIELKLLYTNVRGYAHTHFVTQNVNLEF